MKKPTKNPFTWVEIYVADMNRARAFYERVLDIQMEELTVPDGVGELHMMSFPWAVDEKNISGALVQTKGMTPGIGGTLAYFDCDDCAVEESRVESAGGQVLRSKIPLGDYGFCSIVKDTEGNMIGLHSMK